MAAGMHSHWCCWFDNSIAWHVLEVHWSVVRWHLPVLCVIWRMFGCTSFLESVRHYCLPELFSGLSIWFSVSYFHTSSCINCFVIYYNLGNYLRVIISIFFFHCEILTCVKMKISVLVYNLAFTLCWFSFLQLVLCLSCFTYRSCSYKFFCLSRGAKNHTKK